MCIYGYCRISTPKQNIERQIIKITRAYPTAIIIKEIFTGTKVDGRKEFERLLKQVKQGDIIVFDEVSRMSRNAEDGFNLYQKLFNNGVELVFLREPHINTAVYRKAISTAIPMTDTNVDYILKGINEYLMALAKEQIRIAFQQAQTEIDYLHQRTSEGIQRAKADGKRVGTQKGDKLTTKKSIRAKEIITKRNWHFGGALTDAETIKLAGVSKNSFYKYLRELQEE